jgi:hypothetical protein
MPPDVCAVLFVSFIGAGTYCGMLGGVGIFTGCTFTLNCPFAAVHTHTHTHTKSTRISMTIVWTKESSCSCMCVWCVQAAGVGFQFFVGGGVVRRRFLSLLFELHTRQRTGEGEKGVAL